MTASDRLKTQKAAINDSSALHTLYEPRRISDSPLPVPDVSVSDTPEGRGGPKRSYKVSSRDRNEGLK